MKYTFGIDTFDLDSGKDMARKIAEEAAEAFSAWESWDADPYPVMAGEYGTMGSYGHLLYECCDTIQAACNLMAAYGATQADVDAAYAAVRAHNAARGRYGTVPVPAVQTEDGMPTAAGILAAWLESHGCDGLCDPDAGCGCGTDDLCPCGIPGNLRRCVPARGRTALDGEPAWFPAEPLLGNRRPHASKTHWLLFYKPRREAGIDEREESQ